MYLADDRYNLHKPSITPRSDLLRWHRNVTVCLFFAPFLRLCFPRQWKHLSEALLSTAAFIGSEEFVVRLLSLGADPNAAGRYYGLNPLLSAAVQGHLSITRILLRAGADSTTDTGKNTLMQAAEYGNTDIVAWLLDEGGDIDAVDHSGQTALFKAAAAGHLSTVRLLIERGANPQIRMRRGSGLIASKWARLISQTFQGAGDNSHSLLECAEYARKPA